MKLSHIGIVGAGTMGAALAQKFAQEGLAVVLVDREERFLQRGMVAIRETLREGVARRLFSDDQVAAIISRISPTTQMADLAPCELTIEAVFEDRQVKHSVLGEISGAVALTALIATNTSSFSVTELATGVVGPERFLGLHFFYHAAKNRLVEVVRGRDTADQVFNDALAIMQRCGKDPIVSADAHGFVINRFFVPWLNEAVRLADAGVADLGSIDAVACEVFRCGMGPFALMNATGVPIALHAQRTLREAYGDFYQPADGLIEQVDRGEVWDIPGPGAISPDAKTQITDRLLGVVLLVCGQLLDEQVCAAGELHRGARIGLRWGKSPLDLYHRLGQDRVRELAAGITTEWRLALPAALSPEHWHAGVIDSRSSGRIGILTVNRPEALNALNPVVVDQLGAAFDSLAADDNIDTIVITGSGKAFVAGADIGFFIGHIKRGTLPEIVTFTRQGQELLQRIDDCPKTVVAVVNGLALGGGLELALAADRIVALPGALLAFPETGIGIYPGLGGTQRTTQRIGSGLTKYLIYTGQMLTAGQAQEIGLVDNVVTWEELDAVLDGSTALEAGKPDLSADWRQVAEVFDKYTLDDLLVANEGDDPDLASGKIAKARKKIRRKAPVALRLAERLIDAGKGPTSELEYLVEIFSTKDALAGLFSTGGPPPEFKGE
ncbi:MAG: 3-hydroxyacyl-CoA dehydrogenase/enoyl-CoA hydratase family protein [Candidatus Neomarinimicrobiota bacterium]